MLVFQFKRILTQKYWLIDSDIDSEFWLILIQKTLVCNTNMAAMALVELVPGEWVQTLYFSQFDDGETSGVTTMGSDHRYLIYTR
jgi:hypothetical protein